MKTPRGTPSGWGREAPNERFPIANIMSFSNSSPQTTFAASHLATHWRRQPTKDAADVNVQSQCMAHRADW